MINLVFIGSVWSWHNKHFWKFSVVHGFISFTVNALNVRIIKSIILWKCNHSSFYRIPENIETSNSKILELLWKRILDKQKEKKICNKLNSERNEHYCKFTLFILIHFGNAFDWPYPGITLRRSPVENQYVVPWCLGNVKATYIGILYFKQIYSYCKEMNTKMSEF